MPAMECSPADRTIEVETWLKQQKPGLLGIEAIKWNFTKFLLDKEGQVFDRYAPQTDPEALAADIEVLLSR